MGAVAGIAACLCDSRVVEDSPSQRPRLVPKVGCLGWAHFAVGGVSGQKR